MRSWPPWAVIDAEVGGVAGALQRWLGFIFFSAFLALWFEIEGLIGPAGILPAGHLLQALRQAYPGAGGAVRRVLLAPSLLWMAGGSTAIHGLCALGMAAAGALMLRLKPRIAAAICLVSFLSFLSTAQAFASYQSDGMLMSAGLIALFLDNRRPGWWPMFAARWLWFTIYFGSGVAKIASGDPQWRRLTALNHYYQNAPLPSRMGWYAQNYLPHGLEAGLALATLVIELALVWLCFGPRRARIALFWIATGLQIGIILSANYGFLNFLVLGLGLTLVDDQHLHWLLHLPQTAVRRMMKPAALPGASGAAVNRQPAPEPRLPLAQTGSAGWRPTAWAMVPIAYVAITGMNLAHRVLPRFPAPERVDAALAPFRVVDSFGLFAVMTTAEYEISFQGSSDGVHWTSYPFKFKPQDPHNAPGWFGPYQPRFDWNLWFASLGSYRDNPWVLETEARLLENDPAVLALFAGNPFAAHPPIYVRAVVWQYRFSTPAEKRRDGVWWRRRYLGLYTPAIERRTGLLPAP